MNNQTSTNSTAKSAWVVVEVHSGIPVEVKAFLYREKATKYLEAIRENLNPNNDEAGVFEVDLISD